MITTTSITIDTSKTAFPRSEVWVEMNETCSGSVELVLRARCTRCGKVLSKLISSEESGKVKTLYENGGFHPDGHVQDVFPDWSCAEREFFLMSHICDDCWKRMFGTED